MQTVKLITVDVGEIKQTLDAVYSKSVARQL